MKESPLKMVIQPERAYLELARSFHGASFCRVDGKAGSDEVTITDNTQYALVSQAYVFSHAALVAFVNSQLCLDWSEPNSKLRQDYPDTSDLTHLLRDRLGELKEAIKALCCCRCIRQLHEADVQLWNDLLQVCKKVRDFVMHSKPIDDEFHDIIVKSHMEHTLGFPSQVAERVLTYLISGMCGEVPLWVRQNQEFKVTHVAALTMRELCGEGSTINKPGRTGCAD